MPLDLHVLGLPLAFILSQDQTLRCTESCPILPSDHPVRAFSPRGAFLSGLTVFFFYCCFS